MDGAGHARLVRLLLGGAVALLSLVAAAVLVSSSFRATVAEAPPGGSAALAKTTAEEPCDKRSGEGPSAMLVNEDGRHFASLAQAVATADLVVLGTVSEVRPGGIGPANSPEEQIETLEAVMRVDEVLKGRAPGGPLTLETMEQAYTAGNTEWRCPGERALLFLSRSTEKPGGSTSPTIASRLTSSMATGSPLGCATNSETRSSSASKASHYRNSAARWGRRKKRSRGARSSP